MRYMKGVVVCHAVECLVSQRLSRSITRDDVFSEMTTLQSCHSCMVTQSRRRSFNNDLERLTLPSCSHLSLMNPSMPQTPANSPLRPPTARCRPTQRLNLQTLFLVSFCHLFPYVAFPVFHPLPSIYHSTPFPPYPMNPPAHRKNVI